VIGEGARIWSSVVLNDCRIGSEAQVHEAILAPGVVIGPEARIGPDAVIGEGARIEPGAEIADGARLAPGEVVS